MKYFLKGSFRLITILLAIVYLFSCFTPYISPAIFWPLTYIALGFSFVAAALLISIIIWFFVHKRIALVLLLLFFAGYKNIVSVFGFNVPKAFNAARQPHTLRVITWNVKIFDNNFRYAEHPDSVRRKMINYLLSLNADVLLLQEFIDIDNPYMYSNAQTLSDTLGYKYYIISDDRKGLLKNEHVKTGTAIFSRLPLTDTGRIWYPDLPMKEGFLTASIVFEGKKINIFTTHLLSMNINKINNVDDPFKRADNEFVMQSTVSEKLKHFDSIHSLQANFLKSFINKSKYPVIVSGDFNATPASYTYHTVSDGLSDAFIYKGSGLDRTFSAVSPTLRIDYLLFDKALRINQFSSPKRLLSDHYPVVADLQWK